MTLDDINGQIDSLLEEEDIICQKLHVLYEQAARLELINIMVAEAL